MKYKFIYCTDEETKNQLIKKYSLINEKTINGVYTWVFSNNEEALLSFSALNGITFSNKMFI